MIVVLLGMLAVGTVVHAASTTTMTLHMATADEMGIADDATTHVDGCTACQAGDMPLDGAACGIVCATSFAATISGEPGLAAPATGVPLPVSSIVFSGRTAPPDLLPPRAIFLL